MCNVDGDIVCTVNQRGVDRLFECHIDRDNLQTFCVDIQILKIDSRQEIICRYLFQQRGIPAQTNVD